MDPHDTDVEQVIESAEDEGIDTERALKIVSQISPVILGVVQSLASRCEDIEADDLDDLGMPSPYELYGLLVDKANLFIQSADSPQQIDDCLGSLKTILTEVTLFLYNIYTEILDGEEEEDGEEEGEAQEAAGSNPARATADEGGAG